MYLSRDAVQNILKNVNQRSTANPEHHVIFDLFQVDQNIAPPGFKIDMTGSLVDVAFEAPGIPGGGTASRPQFDEEYFEWIDVLESVALAKDRYVVAELGAGYGRWAVRGVRAARAYGLTDIRACLVEAEPKHVRFAEQHLANNKVPPDTYTLRPVAVSGERSSMLFAVKPPPGFLPEGSMWFGQANIPHIRFEHTTQGTEEYFGRPILQMPGGWGGIAVDCWTIGECLEGYDKVDLLDMDIQGAEGDAVEGGIDSLNAKVKRLHIGTHSHEVEDRLRDVLSRHGWAKLRDYPCQTKMMTPFGEIFFGDGVQSWLNPALHG